MVIGHFDRPQKKFKITLEMIFDFQHLCVQYDTSFNQKMRQGTLIEC